MQIEIYWFMGASSSREKRRGHKRRRIRKILINVFVSVLKEPLIIYYLLLNMWYVSFFHALPHYVNILLTSSRSSYFCFTLQLITNHVIIKIIIYLVSKRLKIIKGDSESCRAGKCNCCKRISVRSLEWGASRYKSEIIGDILITETWVKII